MGLKDWFQKKLKQKPADEEFSSFSESQEKKDNLSYVEPEVNYSTNTDLGLSREVEDAQPSQTSSEVGMDDNLGPRNKMRIIIRIEAQIGIFAL